MSEGKMSAEELAQAREVARKPHRFESAHPTKWSDLTERLLAHIATLQREADGMREALEWIAEERTVFSAQAAALMRVARNALTGRPLFDNGSPQEQAETVSSRRSRAHALLDEGYDNGFGVTSLDTLLCEDMSRADRLDFATFLIGVVSKQEDRN